MARPEERVAVARGRARSVRAEIDAWLTDHSGDDRFSRFTGHFTVLGTVFERMLEAVDTRLGAVELADGVTHDRCRELETSLSRVRRLHRWYADKYDQRLDQRAAPVLRAADEVVRSCWTEPFAGRTAPPGPLVHLDSRYDAYATPRVSVPSDLRGDPVVASLVRELPVPVVALPAVSVEEPWWLVLAAHETGHHVQHELGLVASTRAALDAATGGAWGGWAEEAFADAFSVVLVGTAATWAVVELQHGSFTRLTRLPQPGDFYPPPVIRTALLGEVARCLGLPDPGPGVDDVRSWGVGPVLSAHLDVTSAAARALVTPLRELCGFDSDLLLRRVDMWKRVFASGTAATGRGERSAARFGIAGAVAAYRSGSCARVAEELETCGPTGTLAEAPVRGLDDVADRLAARLFEEPS